MYIRHRSAIVTLLCLLLVGPLALPPVAHTDGPTLILTPDRGPCDVFNPPIAVRDRDIPADTSVTLVTTVPAPTRGCGRRDRECRDGGRRDVHRDGTSGELGGGVVPRQPPQYFERVRLEYHPRSGAPYDVLFNQFGRRILAESGR